MATSTDTKPPPKLGEDAADMLSAIVNIWLALEAIRKTLPEAQEQSVSMALDGLAKVMSSLMKRYNVDVSPDIVVKESGHE